MGLTALHWIPKFVKNHSFRKKYSIFTLRLEERKIFYQGLTSTPWSPPDTSTPCSPPHTSASSSSPPGPSTAPVDDEQHFVIKCTRFYIERNTAFKEMSTLVPNFLNMSKQQKFTTFLCPTQPQTAKIANRLIKRMFELREKIYQSRNDINCTFPVIAIGVEFVQQYVLLLTLRARITSTN